jgi:DNA-binding XRE family transcriptional regulator
MLTLQESDVQGGNSEPVLRQTESSVTLASLFVPIFRAVLPRRITHVRKLLGLTQAGLARRSRIAVSSLNQIEAGFPSDVRLTTLLKLGHVLRATPDYLCGFDDSDHVRRHQHQHGGAHCATCGHRGRHIAVPHSQGECIVRMWEAGHSVEYLAVAYGFTVRTIEAILQHESRAIRRHPA